MSEEGADTLLQANGLIKKYGGRPVVNEVDLQVNAGEIVGLLGPNGAGKTTCFYMIIGLIRPDGGSVVFQGNNVSKLPMYQRARLGMGYLSQEPSVFRKMTVADNIMAVLETMQLSREERKNRLRDLLNELQLTELANQKAVTLSGGERRRLEITRALATNPAFIMLDEPFSGVDPINVYEVQKIIGHLRDRGLGVFLTDHSVRETLEVVERAYLIADGRVICQGNSEHLINDEEARRVYLGPRFAA